jgi:hypothetical protein
MANDVPPKYELVSDTHRVAEGLLREEDTLVDQLTYDEQEIDDIVATGGDRLTTLREGSDRASELLAREGSVKEYFSDDDDLGRKYLTTGRHPSGGVMRQIAWDGDRSVLDPLLLDTTHSLPTAESSTLSWLSLSGLWVGFWALLALFIVTPFADALGVGYRGQLGSLAVLVGATAFLTVGRDAYYRWLPGDAPEVEDAGDVDPLARVKWNSLVNGLSFLVLAFGVLSISLDAFGTFIGSVLAVLLIAAVAMVVLGGVLGYLAGTIGAGLGMLVGLAIVLWWYSGNIASYVDTTPYLGTVAPGLPGSEVVDLLLVTLALAGLLGTVLYAVTDLPATLWRAYVADRTSPPPGVYSCLVLAPLFGFGWALLLAQEAALQGGLLGEGLFLALSGAPAIIGTVYVAHYRVSS